MNRKLDATAWLSPRKGTTPATGFTTQTRGDHAPTRGPADGAAGLPLDTGVPALVEHAAIVVTGEIVDKRERADIPDSSKGQAQAGHCAGDPI